MAKYILNYGSLKQSESLNDIVVLRFDSPEELMKQVLLFIQPDFIEGSKEEEEFFFTGYPVWVTQIEIRTMSVIPNNPSEKDIDHVLLRSACSVSLDDEFINEKPSAFICREDMELVEYVSMNLKQVYDTGFDDSDVEFSLFIFEYKTYADALNYLMDSFQTSSVSGLK